MKHICYVIPCYHILKLRSIDSMLVIHIISNYFRHSLHTIENRKQKYYYNNNVNTEPDIVKLKGGKVNIKNGLIGSSDNQEVELDEDGGASYVFTPQNTTFLLADDDALKSVSITLEYDESFYDIKPMNGDIFRGYVMATLPKAEGRGNQITLFHSPMRSPKAAKCSMTFLKIFFIDKKLLF